jgi:predicted nucleic acid-binding protein
MIVVADASPLIFLAKIEKLILIPRLFAGELLVPSSVRDEVLAAPIAPAEALALGAFLASCRVVGVRRPRRFAAALSRADSEALTLALRRRADLLLSDERLLRAMARLEGVRPMGTLGVLLRAHRAGMLSATEARTLVETLIREHRFRIGIEVYEAVQRAIDRMAQD